MQNLLNANFGKIERTSYYGKRSQLNFFIRKTAIEWIEQRSYFDFEFF